MLPAAFSHPSEAHRTAWANACYRRWVGRVKNSLRFASSLAAALLDSLFAHPACSASSQISISVTTIEVGMSFLRILRDDASTKGRRRGVNQNRFKVNQNGFSRLEL